MTLGLRADYRSDPLDHDLGLRQACAQRIDQCVDVVQKLSGDLYVQSRPGSSPIGTHVRHIIERVTCVLDGIPVGRVNYDQRARNPVLECDRDGAVAALRDLRSRLLTLDSGPGPDLLVSESIDERTPPAVLPSSLNRELLSLISHTIHHLAIIALLARSAGIVLPDDIGKAPSTILYQRSLPTAEQQ